MSTEFDRIRFAGALDLRWWDCVIAPLLMTHATIICVTLFLHRHQAHRALHLHPVASHPMRLWLWMTTGMVTREWVAIHRKHHAKVDAPEDPHSPQMLGLGRVLWGGVLLYVKESRNRATIERYGHGAPDDWAERAVYSRLNLLGLTLTGVADVTLFGVVPGLLIFPTQVVWIPFASVPRRAGCFRWWSSRSACAVTTRRNEWLRRTLNSATTRATG